MAGSTQRQEVSEALKEPHTIEELADVCGGNYHAIWRVVKKLEDEGIVREQPWRRDKKKVYVLSGTARAGVVMMHTKRAAFPLSHWGRPYGGVNHGAMLHGIVSYIWRRSYHMPPVGQGEDIAKFRGSHALVEVRANLRQLRDAAETMRMLADQLLLADVWTEDDREVWKKFGDLECEPAEVLEMARYYEKVLEQLSAQQAAAQQK